MSFYWKYGLEKTCIPAYFILRSSVRISFSPDDKLKGYCCKNMIKIASNNFIQSRSVSIIFRLEFLIRLDNVYSSYFYSA